MAQKNLLHSEITTEAFGNCLLLSADGLGGAALSSVAANDRPGFFEQQVIVEKALDRSDDLLSRRSSPKSEGGGNKGSLHNFFIIFW
jgi:hypothetical protein